MFGEKTGRHRFEFRSFKSKSFYGCELGVRNEKSVTASYYSSRATGTRSREVRSSPPKRRKNSEKKICHVRPCEIASTTPESSRDSQYIFSSYLSYWLSLKPHNQPKNVDVNRSSMFFPVAKLQVTAKRVNDHD